MLEAIANELKQIVGEEHVLTKPTDLLVYGYDCSYETRLRRRHPDIVVRPGSAEEVAAVVKVAAREKIPVTARSAGSSQTAGPVPVQGGIVVDMLRLNRILEYDLENLQVIVEPGIVHARFNDLMKPHGFFFPPDPGSSKFCTLGGMVANCSSGMRAVKYGTTRHYVHGLEVVLPSGEIIWTGGQKSRALKSVSGYDLTQLLIGSEGTLGIITKIRLKVVPIPEKRGVALAAFKVLEDTGRAVQEIFRQKALPSAIEILDAGAIRTVVNHDPSTGLPTEAEALLLFEVDGSPAEVAYQAKRIADICAPLAFQVEWSDDPAAIGRLWSARQTLGAAAARLKPGSSRVYDGEDICVPIGRIPQALRRIATLAEEHGLFVVTYGHVGDGNLHAAIIADFRDPQEMGRAQKLAEAIHWLALELGGTVTAEHGVGITRMQYMEAEHGPALAAMRLIKQALDPDNIMNPGKMAL